MSEAFEELTDEELIRKKAESWNRYQESLNGYLGGMESSRRLFLYRQVESEYKKRFKKNK